VTVTNPETTAEPRVLPRLPEELISSTSFLLKRLGFAAKDQAMEAYERSGLHPYHHAVLAVLDEGSRETQGAIADALGYDRGQLVGLLDELEDRGLVERRRDPADRRRHIVRLTPAGKRALAKLRALARQLDDDFLASLDEDERAQLHALLLRLAQQHLPHCAPKTS
jgi:DNA-binding MarR family transcriptional regulator